MSKTDWLITSSIATIPDGLEDIPGVWAKKSGVGYMVPFNTIKLWGQRQIPTLLLPEHGIKVFESMFTDKRIKLYLDLFEHQIDMLLFAFSRTGSNIWAPPAAGKTRVGIYYLLTDRPPYIVICKSANTDVWRKEIDKWTTCKAQILTGQNASKMAITVDAKHINILSWELLPHWYEVIKDTQFTGIVFDECHMAKNFRRSKAVVDEDGNTTYESKENWSDFARKLAGIIPRRLCMTGTPIANTRMDLYAQLDLAEPFAWGGASQWGKRYMEYEETEYGIKWGKKGTNNDELKARLAFSAQRISMQTIHKTLPPFRRDVVIVRLDQQVRAMGHSIKETRAIADNLQVTGDLDSESAARELLILEAASRKRSYLIDDAIGAIRIGYKICILTGRKIDCDYIVDRLSKGLKAKQTGTDMLPIFVAHGDIGGPDCDQAIDSYMAYQRAEGKIGAALIGTGHKLGTGLNLQDTDIAYIVQLPSTPEQILQWEMRFIRPGRTEPVLIRYLIAENTIDEDMRTLILDKLDDLSSLLGDDKAQEIIKALKPISGLKLLQRIQACINPKADHDARFQQEQDNV